MSSASIQQRDDADAHSSRRRPVPTTHSHHVRRQHIPSEVSARDLGVPWNVAQPALVAYRSTGIGFFGALMRYLGMPLEKIALYMNSSQVSGKGQFRQAIQLTFAEGALAPYRVVGPSSLTAWFMQYSVMGVAFQLVDQTLSNLMGVRPVYYGHQLMQPPDNDLVNAPLSYQIKVAAKTLICPVISGCFESFVANRAEVQRYFGPVRFAEIESRLANNSFVRIAGPAFAPNAARNIIMCQTSFLLTPLTYKRYFPQEYKSKTTLFWYGLGCNIFVGNMIAITQQAAWGRSLDYLARNGCVSYSQMIQESLAKDGISAFFTLSKWSSRVLMNAPAQGTLPWFYNEVLPLGERWLLQGVKHLFYDSFLARGSMATTEPVAIPKRLSALQRQRSRIGTLTTANPDFLDETDDDAFAYDSVINIVGIPAPPEGLDGVSARSSDWSHR
ncbi:hypothetical protein MPSEU_000601300 [Mayamaea pseudoterrestris]|nr:hypothetical protein MPSEU_000601300 [Mayamaea pseudoterrestris]